MKVSADREGAMKSIPKGASRFYGKILPWGCFLFLLTTSCRNGNHAVTGAKTDADDDVPASATAFVLHNLGIHIDSWNPATNRAGDFLFKAGEEKVFIEFGARVVVEGGGTTVFPAFEYRIDRNALVTAVAEGRIAQFDRPAGGRDYRIRIRSNADPLWEVLYNHIQNPLVAMGDTISAGEALGNPGPWDSDLGRVQIQVVHLATGFSHCPLSRFDSLAADTARAKVLRLMADWESFKNDPGIYDEEEQNSPGCGVTALDATQIPETHPAFLIRCLGVRFGPWDPATNRVGDFVFREKEDKVYIGFGSRVTPESGETNVFPATEYRVDRNAAVMAVADGRIVTIERQPGGGNCRIFCRSIVDPRWDVLYNRVGNPRVSVGDTVFAGDPIASPGPWDGGLGRFQVLVINTTTNLSHCPTGLFDADSAETFRARLHGLMSDWESFKNDATIYDDGQDLDPAGCGVQTLDWSEVPELYPAFTISGLGVNFGPWDRSTNRAGDFVFNEREQKVFLEFGAKVGSGDGGIKELPTFEYRIDRNAQVTAVASGRIVRFVYQEETQDYEILARSLVNPDWDVGYDHVTNVRVAMGDTVFAGTVLGNPGPWYDQGRFEIMINNNTTGLSYCPFCVFDEDSAEAFQERVLRHIKDWEEFKNDVTIYNEENHPLPGCIYRDMKTY